MAVKSIKRVLKDAIVADMESQMSAELDGVQVIASFAGLKLDEQHIRVTAQATPQVIGKRNLGRWDVTAMVSAVSQIDDTDNDTHDNLVGLIEAYVLQGNATLAARLTDASIVFDNVRPGPASEVAIEGMLYSGMEVLCECYLTGV